jgi:nucleolar protein 4
MRDMKEMEVGGKGTSKCFGFVTFTQHDHALAALRAVNNNPEVFTPSQVSTTIKRVGSKVLISHLSDISKY